MKFDCSNKFDLCYYGQENSPRLKSNIASKWQVYTFGGNIYFAGDMLLCFELISNTLNSKMELFVVGLKIIDEFANVGTPITLSDKRQRHLSRQSTVSSEEHRSAMFACRALVLVEDFVDRNSLLLPS